MPDAREELTAALAAQAAAERRLHAAVHAAREAGWSWAAVAEELGVTRQAAHRRFHAAPVPHQDDDAAAGSADPRGVARAVLEAWTQGDLPAVHAQLTSTARAQLPQSALREVWQEVTDLAGPCAGVEVTGLHTADGEPLDAPGGRRTVVVRAMLRCAEAEPVAHVLIGPSGRVAGLSVRLRDTLECWPL